MNPQTLQLALIGVEFIIREYPIVADEIKSLLSQENPTPEDWHQLRARVLAKSYQELVPNTAL
jgi:hypothetical protein